MKDRWQSLSTTELQQIYQQSSMELERRLLRGSSWQEVSRQRSEVTELALVIYKRLSKGGDNGPAESTGRRKYVKERKPS